VKEDFLQYIWQYQLFDTTKLETTSGDLIEILNQGTLNHDAGPDFFNAKIKIGNTIWAGNIEIHYNASEWDKHKHQNDESYNSVILHVVKNNDKTILSANKHEIPTLIMRVDEKLLVNFNALRNNPIFPACTPYLHFVPQFTINHQINRTTIERLERKTADILLLAEATNNDWSSLLYRLLGKYFGAKTNLQPFEMLTQSLPLKYLAKHKNNLLQIEAMLFGVAGFLEQTPAAADKYYLSLQKEWLFLAAKFNLKPSPLIIWKFSKMRPANFPTVRIAQFAGIIYNSSQLFSKILEQEEVTKIKTFLFVKPSDYWDIHYQFSKTSIKRKKIPGEQFINTLLINVVIPIVFAYGQYIGNEDLKNKALVWLEQLPAENNTIIKKYKTAGFQIETAFVSQGLLTLHENYCKKLNCLECIIGHQIIKKT